MQLPVLLDALPALSVEYIHIMSQAIRRISGAKLSTHVGEDLRSQSANVTVPGVLEPPFWHYDRGRISIVPCGYPISKILRYSKCA